MRVAVNLRRHAGFKFFTEILDGALQRLYRARRVRTESFARPKLAAKLQQGFDIARLAFFPLQRTQDFYAPRQAVAARCTPAARLASKKLFLRGEYIEAAVNLRRAIAEATEAGYLGKNILGTGFDFELIVHTGAGRYICGEETALINSLEGRRANPRSKPPFPASAGVWGKPTCVNNVETLSNVPAILANGVDWYKNISKSDDTGTKMMGFSGR